MSELLLGTVTSTSGEGVSVTIDGETSPTTKKYTFIQGYYPQTGDRVVIAEVGNQYVILGKLATSRLQSSARFVNDQQTTNRNIYFSTLNNEFWIGYASKSGGNITWKKITVA
jgi:hypothetical protein